VSGEHEVRAASKVRGMLPLNDARWTALSDAYGASTGIPKLLAHAATLPEDFGEGAEPYFSLWSALCHQGDVYSASYAALPHLVRIVEENPGRFRWTLLLLVNAIELARSAGRGPPVPDDLTDAYQRAPARIPAIAGGLLIGDRTELELRVILAACASARGYPTIAEAIIDRSAE